MMSLKKAVFGFFNVSHRIRIAVRHSLQVRTVVSVIMVTAVTAVVFSLVSMVSVRASMMEQAMSQARDDFSNLVTNAQRYLHLSQANENAAYQHLVNEMASNLQNEGDVNLVGIYMWSRSSGNEAIIPISTEPSHSGLVSDDMRNGVVTVDSGSMCYQPVRLTESDDRYPGAVLGTLLDFDPVGDLEMFALYSYEDEQASLTYIQRNLLLICALLSALIGAMTWVVMHRIIKPIQAVADTSERLAAGELNVRVPVNRKDEIGILQRSFNDMAESLNEKIGEMEKAAASQRMFVSDVSHELRTPVTTMRMASDLLESRKNEFDPVSRRTVELLSGQIERFQGILTDLLEISRYDAGRVSLDLADIDIRAIIEDAMRQVHGLAVAKNVPIHAYLPARPILVCADARRITRVIRNLLSNAIDFAEDKPIEIRVSSNRWAVVVSVRDFGAGISPEQMTFIFDRFWRGDQSRSRIAGGTGLGLSISLSDVQIHQGTLCVRSSLGEGTWFLMALPRDQHMGVVEEDRLPVSFVDDTALEVRGDFDAAALSVEGAKRDDEQA